MIEKNFPLSKLSTWGMGGPAAYYVQVSDADSAKEALAFAKLKQLPYFIVGKGSNCLFDDRGFSGLIIHQVTSGTQLSQEGLLEAQAGESLALLAASTSKLGWSGLEFGIGIPGSIGGAVCMNAGAHGQQISDTLQEVRFLSDSGKEEIYDKNQLIFGYRTSSFQQKKGIILSARFQLSSDLEACPRMKAHQEKRKKTQPTRFRSAGCVFRNPDGDFAGALIEKAGLKGTRRGNISVSEIHGNFLINHGNGSSRDAVDLIEHIQHQIQTLFGKKLQREVKTVPYDGFSS